jgi:hypothetical protein
MVMPSVELSWLTNALWLAAHDSVNGKPAIGAWPLGVGLATGLLAELVHGHFLQLHRGALFRTASVPNDPALRPLLVKMEAEEQSSPSPAELVQAQGRASDGGGRSAPVRAGQDWPAAGDRQHWHAPGVRAEHQHSSRGHQLRDWVSYLAYERRAEELVIDRLASAALVRQEQHQRLLGGVTVRYVPYDSVVAGTPASAINAAVKRGDTLSESQLFLAGLFLATGLHHQALATLTSTERLVLSYQLGRRLDPMSRELLKAADTAVGEAAMR